MDIYLVRHAQSQSNVDHKVLHNIPNPSIELTDVGKAQALETGQFLKTELAQTEVNVFKSPYKRTQQTSEIIESAISNHVYSIESKTNIQICERQFGIVDDVDDYKNKYPDYINHYKLHTDHDVAFFARPPLGESPFDVSLRIDFFIKHYLLHPSNLKSNKNQIIVSHGAAIRCFLMMSLNWPHEQFFNEKNPANASVRHLVYDEGTNSFKDHGYVFIPNKITD